jgi:hypothetical protein
LRTFFPLIAVPAVRSIPQVLDSIYSIPEFDKLFIRNHPESQAYRVIQDNFLKGPQYYTHLILWPDDLVVPRTMFEKLALGVYAEDYPVISGYCNIDGELNKDLANICIDHVPSIEQAGRKYVWPTLEHVASLRPTVIRVKFMGFPLAIIRRDVLQQVRLTTDSVFNGALTGGCCVDVVFSWQCDQKNIPLYVDTTCRLEHLKHNDALNAQAAAEAMGKAKQVVFETRKKP